MSKQSVLKQIFLKKAKSKHQSQYDYSLCEYVNGKTEVKIKCTICNSIFEIKPTTHLMGKGGCIKCCLQRSYLANTCTNQEFIDKANKIHNNIFDYSKCNYIGARHNVTLICEKHGEFNIIASNHLQGCGCKTCGKESSRQKSMSTQQEFTDHANKIHKFKYDYSKSKYDGYDKKVLIICKTHGEFWQTPSQHLNYKGCIKCSKSVSKVEVLWLDYLNIPEIYRHKIIFINGKRFNLDAYDPNTNTIYEFYGTFFHGSPEIHKPEDFNTLLNKTFGELYQKTIEREKILKNEGYNIITIWENHFRKILKENKKLSTNL